jgi:dynactin 1
MPHVDEVRASKSSFQLGKVLSFVNNIASSTVAKICKNTAPSWTALSDAISELSAQTNALFPKTTDPENIVKSVHNTRLLRNFI